MIVLRNSASVEALYQYYVRHSAVFILGSNRFNICRSDVAYDSIVHSTNFGLTSLHIAFPLLAEIAAPPIAE